MLFTRQYEKAILAIQEDVRSLREEITGYSQGVREELAVIRQALKDLILLLEEDRTEREDLHAAVDRLSAIRVKEPDPTEAADPRLISDSVEKLAAQAAAVALACEQMEAAGREVMSALQNGLKPVEESIADARKEIIGRINYAVARLRT